MCYTVTHRYSLLELIDKGTLRLIIHIHEETTAPKFLDTVGAW